MIPWRRKETTVGSPHSSNFQILAATGKFTVCPSNIFISPHIYRTTNMAETDLVSRPGQIYPFSGREGRNLSIEPTISQQYLALDNGR